MAKVFLSRSAEGYPSLKKYLAESSHDLISQSLISIDFLDFDVPENVDWVFFSSRNAVESYFARKCSQKVKYAALGSGTAAVLETYASVDFVGDETDVVKSAKNFSDLVGDKVVLFPSSNIGLRTVQNELPDVQVIDIVSYQTSLRPVEIPECEIYIFSSPSNVESFVSKNTFPNDSIVLVPGQKTKHKVADYYEGNIIDVRSLADSAITGTIFPDILS